jgi:hypothetical protein
VRGLDSMLEVLGSILGSIVNKKKKKKERDIVNSNKEFTPFTQLALGLVWISLFLNLWKQLMQYKLCFMLFYEFKLVKIVCLYVILS